MARKLKQGLDYFPHDCSLDDELKYVIAEHKETGYYIYFRLLEKIYSENGYFMKSDEKTLKLYCNEINVDIIKINDVINTCLCEHLFCKEKFEKYQILTSKGIQERYIEAIDRRKEISFIEQYLLLDLENVSIKLKNVNINLINVDNNSQSKVKYSKVNESKVKHVFKESPYFDFKLFKNEMAAPFQKYDLKFYHEKLVAHGDDYEYENWLTSAERWILNDVQKGKAKLKPFVPRNPVVDRKALEDAGKIWNKVMFDLKEKLSEHDYKTYYIFLKMVEATVEKIRFTVPNEPILKNIKLTLLQEIAAKYLKQEIEVLTKKELDNEKSN